MNWYDFWLWLIYWLSVRSSAWVSLLCWCVYSADHAYVCQDNSLWFAPRGRIRSRCSHLASVTGLAWLHFVFCSRMISQWASILVSAVQLQHERECPWFCVCIMLHCGAVDPATCLTSDDSSLGRLFCLALIPPLLQCPSLNEMNQTACTFV